MDFEEGSFDFSLFDNQTKTQVISNRNNLIKLNFEFFTKKIILSGK